MTFTGHAVPVSSIKENVIVSILRQRQRHILFVSQNPSDAYRRSASLLRDITFNSLGSAAARRKLLKPAE